VLLVVAILLTVFVLSPPLGIAVMVLAALVEVGELLFWRRVLRRYRVSTGAEALVGEAVQVVERCDPEGRVRVRGELWNARASRRIEAGETGVVEAVEGLTLRIAPAED
jgi:membrane-bound serine protease (ClpP class)